MELFQKIGIELGKKYKSKVYTFDWVFKQVYSRYPEKNKAVVQKAILLKALVMALAPEEVNTYHQEDRSNSGLSYKAFIEYYLQDNYLPRELRVLANMRARMRYGYDSLTHFIK